MEIFKRINKSHTLWVGKDAEGRKGYAVTANRDGVAVEPTALHYATQGAAMEAYRSHQERG